MPAEEPPDAEGNTDAADYTAEDCTDDAVLRERGNLGSRSGDWSGVCAEWRRLHIRSMDGCFGEAKDGWLGIVLDDEVEVG